MTPATLAARLATLRWSGRTLASELRCDEAVIRAMLAGRRTIPPEVASWLDHLAAAHQRHPAPVDWRQRAA